MHSLPQVALFEKRGDMGRCALEQTRGCVSAAGPPRAKAHATAPVSFTAATKVAGRWHMRCTVGCAVAAVTPRRHAFSERRGSQERQS